MPLIAPAVLILLSAGLVTYVRDQPFVMTGHSYLDIGAQICLWLSAAWLATRLMSMALRFYAAWRARNGRAVPFLAGGRHLLTDVIGLLVFLGALFGIVGAVLHQPIGGLLATSGLFAAIIGFAMQKMIADVFSGLALTVEGPFSIGDWIDIAGTIGKVTQANWRAVHLETIEGRTVVVPNSQLAGDRFINLNAPERYFRVKHPVCLDYSVPGERAVPILMAAIEATVGVRKTPPPVVLFENSTDLGAVYSLNVWVENYPESFAVTRQLMITALRFLDQAGLVPAYPKRINSMVVTPRQIERSVDIPSVLSRVPLLGLLDAGHIGKLAETARVKEFPAGIAIVNEGEPGESLYVVVAGILEVSLRGEDATARTVARLEPGDVFGEMSLLTGQPRSATVTAASPVILVEIDKAHLEPIFATEPALIGQLTELEAARLISNRDAARLSPAEHAEIGAVGIAAFLRGRILRFFGQAAR